MNIRVDTLGAPSIASDGKDAGWSSRLAFVLAAAGSAIGLMNVWKFPYIAGRYGGGTFVLVYLACVGLIGLPILMAEILIGRRGGGSPIHSFQALAVREGHTPRWRLIGWMGVIGSLLLLSFYSVVAGWSLAYLGYALDGRLSGSSLPAADLAREMEVMFSGLLASPGTLVLCHSLVMAATVFIVAHGIRRGLERTARWLVPGLLLLLLALVAYAATSTGQFPQAVTFLFSPNFSALTWEAVLVALGHAFMTLSVGMTAMMAYGSHLGREVSIGKASLTIAGLDTLVAILAGLAIFPVVFANGLQPDSGPGLVFVTLPIAFAQIPGGNLAAQLFFVFLSLAALTSTISILEPAVEYIEQRFGWSRWRAAALTGGAIWLLGLGSALAFNVWSGFEIMGRNLFDLSDHLTSAFLLPLGGLAIAVYVGWVLSRSSLEEELGLGSRKLFRLWRFVIRYVTPIGVGVVLVSSLF